MSEELSSRPCEAAAEKEGLAVGDIAQAGVLIALLAVSAQVTVALGPIPFTLQTVAVVLAALVFSPAQAALALGGYLLLGGLGLPVFSAMRGGIAMLAGPTGGYLYGFVLAVWLGSLARRAVCPSRLRVEHRGRSLAGDIAAALVVMAVYYVVGTVHFLAMGMIGGSPYELSYVLGVCVVPFLIPDVLKAVVAILVASALRKAVPSVAQR